MAQEYILIKEKNEEVGLIALQKAVFETISQISVDEDDSVVLLDSSVLKKSIQCKIVENHLNVSVDVKVKYGANVNQVCELLQERIATNIYQMTNLKCNLIDVKVAGFTF